jgi:hypothetical protein
MLMYLSNPMAPGVTLEALLAEMRRIFQLAAGVNQPLSEHQKTEALARAVASNRALTFAVNAYYNANPSMATQSFNGLAATLLAAARNAISLTPAQMELSAMAPHASALGAAAGTDSSFGAFTGKPRQTPTGTPRQPQHPAAPHAPRPPRNNRLHCWYHGDCGHSGDCCDKQDTPGFQTEATKANPGTGAVGDWVQVRLLKRREGPGTHEYPLMKKY